MKPHDKIMIDALVEVGARDRESRYNRRSWWLLAAGCLLCGAWFIGALPGWLRISSLVVGGAAILIALVYFSTTDFGKALAEALDNYSGNRWY